uniref:AlNc14C267G9905 protein n=1 Tax=Albugo laibachii Nc14 TaxID=890382 RepID=F0WU84_9STRA|nr:AlNc14C267G9905 [Albugo laibachii Nc14]|eukprot:CCA24962.1 AlNc14C267G9905 [Albugo laibachii Nc14]
MQHNNCPNLIQNEEILILSVRQLGGELNIEEEAKFIDKLKRTVQEAKTIAEDYSGRRRIKINSRIKKYEENLKPLFRRWKDDQEYLRPVATDLQDTEYQLRDIKDFLYNSEKETAIQETRKLSLYLSAQHFLHYLDDTAATMISRLGRAHDAAKRHFNKAKETVSEAHGCSYPENVGTSSYSRSKLSSNVDPPSWTESDSEFQPLLPKNSVPKYHSVKGSEE